MGRRNSDEGVDVRGILGVAFAVLIVCLILLALKHIGPVLPQGIFDRTTIVLNEEERTELSVSLTDMHPGQTQSYTIRLRAKEGESYTVNMAFVSSGADSMAPFVDVEVSVGGQKVQSANLKDCLGGEAVAFPTSFEGGRTVDVQVTYSMSAEVGDEAQNTTADFRIVLTAEREIDE